MINTVSITDLKQNTSKVIKKVKDKQSVVVLQRSKPAAVLIDPDHYQALEEALEDLVDLQAIEDTKGEPTTPFDEVYNKLQKRVSSK